MNKQLNIVITGEFSSIEFKNFVYDKISSFNFQIINPRHPQITGSVSSERENFIRILIEGEEEDLRSVMKLIEKGPIISHIKKVTTEWRRYLGKYKLFSSKKEIK